MLVRHPLPAFISSVITQQHGYGSTSCPWRVELPTGQRVNITLIDFTTNPLSAAQNKEVGGI